MKCLRLLIVPLSAGVLLTAVGLYDAAAVAAQDKQQTEAPKTDKTITGFPTGTTCTRTGIYRAENKYLQVIRVFENGEEFPTFIDGQKTMWYTLAPSAKESFDAVKVAPGSN